MRTSWGSSTDRGRVRTLNEDSLLAYPPVFVVADGMGGHSAGDLASSIAIEEFRRLAGRASVTSDDVHECVQHAAERLRAAVSVGRTAGTTVAGVAVAAHDGGEYWLVFNIGDSRVYRWAAGELHQISVDHSVVQEMVDRGELGAEEAAVHPERHVITRALGTGSEPEPDYWLIPAAPGDRLMVCSDGLTTEIDDDEIRAVLAAEPDPQDAATRLVGRAVEAGGRDNVTVVVVDAALLSASPDVESTRRSEDRTAVLPTPQDDGPEGDVDESTIPRGAHLRAGSTPEVVA